MSASPFSERNWVNMKCVIQYVHDKGFAFADKSVFIPGEVYDRLNQPLVGSVINIVAIPSTRGRSKWTAIQEKSLVNWEEWQIGNEQIILPKTIPGSVHEILTFSCYRCGELLCESEDIWKIKHGCVWTRSDSMVSSGRKFTNKFKKTDAFDALCKSCGYSVGTIYPVYFDSKDNDEKGDRPFPCAKLNICSESRRGNELPLVNGIVLTGVESRDMAEMAISRLQTKIGYMGPRVTAKSFNKVQEIESLQKLLQEAEFDKLQAVEGMKKLLPGEKDNCLICSENSRGYTCINACFTCNECFAGHVMAHTSIEDYGTLREMGGKLSCPMKCGAFLKVEDISLHAPGNPFKKFLDALIEVTRMEERDEEKKRTEKEIKRQAKLSEEEKRFHGYRLKLADLLTLKCPRCSAAFIDFDGCFALSCNRCRCNFCAYCLKDCGNDAHAHVASCSLNPSNDVYGNCDFEEVQNKRKKSAVNHFLSKLTKDERDRIIADNITNLRDLGFRSEAPAKIKDTLQDGLDAVTAYAMSTQVAAEDAELEAIEARIAADIAKEEADRLSANALQATGFIREEKLRLWAGSQTHARELIATAERSAADALTLRKMADDAAAEAASQQLQVRLSAKDNHVDY